MTSDHEEDDTTISKPRPPRTYLDWGRWILGAGILTTAILWTVTITEPIPDMLASTARTTTAVLIIVGTLFILLDRAATWVVAHVRFMIDQLRRMVDDLQMTAERVRIGVDSNGIDLIDVAQVRAAMEQRFDDVDKRFEELAGALAQMRESHLTEVQEAFEMGRLMGPSQSK